MCIGHGYIGCVELHLAFNIGCQGWQLLRILLHMTGRLTQLEMLRRQSGFGVCKHCAVATEDVVCPWHISTGFVATVHCLGCPTQTTLCSRVNGCGSGIVMVHCTMSIHMLAQASDTPCCWMLHETSTSLNNIYMLTHPVNGAVCPPC